MTSCLEQAAAAVRLTSVAELRGKVIDVTGLVIEGTGPLIPVGTQATIRSGSIEMPAQVVGFRGDRVLLMPYSDLQGISPGALITASGAETEIMVSDSML